MLLNRITRHGKRSHLMRKASVLRRMSRRKRRSCSSKTIRKVIGSPLCVSVIRGHIMKESIVGTLCLQDCSVGVSIKRGWEEELCCEKLSEKPPQYGGWKGETFQNAAVHGRWRLRTRGLFLTTKVYISQLSSIGPRSPPRAHCFVEAAKLSRV